MKLREQETKKYVRKFILDDEAQKIEYEFILNCEKITILKEQFAYDKSGRALITVWFVEEVDN